MSSPFAVPVAYDRDRRQPDAPPVDGLAECVCLYTCLFEPTLIDRVDLGPLLTYPEHREIWRLLRGTRAHCTANDSGFYLEWLHALKAAQPEKWLNYLDLVLSVADRQTLRAWAEYEADHCARPYTTYHHDFDWWLARLRRIAEARRLISAACAVLDHAWRVPDREYSVNEAMVAIERATPRTSPRLVAPPIWERADAWRL